MGTATLVVFLLQQNSSLVAHVSAAAVVAVPAVPFLCCCRRC